jgi:hypothetical protein
MIQAAPSLAVAVSVFSAAAYAVAAVVQQRIAADGGPGLHRLLRNRGWWLAVALNGIGGALHVVALRYGPLGLVQPFGALTLVLALPLAAALAAPPVARAAGSGHPGRVNGRRVSGREWGAAALTVAGLVGIFVVTTTDGGTDSRALDLAGIAVLTAGTGAALLLLSAIARAITRAAGPGPAASLLYAVAAGGAFAVASVLTKTITELVPTGSAEIGARLPALALAGAATAGTAAAGLLLSQLAYRGAAVAAPTAVITLANPVVAAAIGLLLLDERLARGTAGTMVALGCGALAAYGVSTLVAADRRHRYTVVMDRRVARGAAATCLAMPGGVPGSSRPRRGEPARRDGELVHQWGHRDRPGRPMVPAGRRRQGPRGGRGPGRPDADRRL